MAPKHDISPDCRHAEFLLLLLKGQNSDQQLRLALPFCCSQPHSVFPLVETYKQQTKDQRANGSAPTNSNVLFPRSENNGPWFRGWTFFKPSFIIVFLYFFFFFSFLSYFFVGTFQTTSACRPFTNNWVNNEWELQRERHPRSLLMNWLPAPRQPRPRRFLLENPFFFFFFSPRKPSSRWWIGFSVRGLFISVRLKVGWWTHFVETLVVQGCWNIYAKTPLPIIRGRVAVNAC